MFVRLSRSGFVPLMLLIALSSLGRAQVAGSTPAKIHLGDPAVDGSFLKPYKNAWKVVYAFPGKEPFLVGVWTDEVTAVQVEGRRLLKRAQMADYAKYNIVTTYANLFDPRTMSPVAMDFKRSDSGEWAH
ncbi:MAG: hypothetical protein ACRD3H_14635, partial [Terriglobales bacterium]